MLGRTFAAWQAAHRRSLAEERRARVAAELAAAGSRMFELVQGGGATGAAGTRTREMAAEIVQCAE
eukprot:2001431-Prymnesium_polylepis.1